jgi:hypothetical protein
VNIFKVSCGFSCTSAASQRPAQVTMSSQVATHPGADRVYQVLGETPESNPGMLHRSGLLMSRIYIISVEVLVHSLKGHTVQNCYGLEYHARPSRQLPVMMLKLRYVIMMKYQR